MSRSPPSTIRARRPRHARPLALRLAGLAGAALWLAVDQASKEIVRASLAYGEVVPVTGFFNVLFLHNRGAAFGMFASGSWQPQALLAFGGLAMLVVAVLLWRSAHDRWITAALALILGGAAGNVIDRVRFGAVVDWLDFHAGGWHWPAFNLADAGLTVGVAILLMRDLTAARRSPARPRES